MTLLKRLGLNKVSKAWLIFAIILIVVSIVSSSWIPFAITVGGLFLVILFAFLIGRSYRSIEEIYVDNNKFDEPGDNQWIH